MNMKEFKPQEKTVVAIGQPADWRDPATVVIGMSDVAFAAMADGRTHTVDLTSQGMSVQIVIFREPTLAACRAKLTETQTTQIGRASCRERVRHDVSIPVFAVTIKKKKSQH